MPPALVAAYTEDANRLALREISSRIQNASPDSRIPPATARRYFNLLFSAWKIYHSQPEIAHLADIRTFPSPDLHKIRVVLKPDAPFRQAWAQGRTNTEDLALNKVLGQYRLSVQNYLEMAGMPTCELVSPDFLDTPEIAFLFSQFGGIQAAEAIGMVGDGNNIEYGPWGKNQVALKFSRGQGDCPSGCMYRKYWIFVVNPENDSLTYFGTEGDLPE